MLGARTPARDGRPQIELPKNKRKVTDGLKWLEPAAELGEGDVASNMGNMYMTGRNPDIPRNYGEGMKLLQKAAELGNGKCAYQLAISHMIGIVPVDEGKRQFWLNKAADMGYVQEMARGIGGFGIQKKTSKKQMKKIEREDDIESMLTTDESTKCSNPTCEERETAETGLFKTCVACRHVKYCSKHCQKTHWKSEHKQECPKLNETKENVKKMNIDMIKNRIVDN